MAHDISQSPYPAVKQLTDEMEEAHLFLVKDARGLYISENVAGDGQLLHETICLTVQWGLDEMREAYGEEALRHLGRALLAGLTNNGVLDEEGAGGRMS